MISLAWPFQANLIFGSTAKSLPKISAPKRCFTQARSGLTQKHWTRLERPARDKHPTQIFVGKARSLPLESGPVRGSTKAALPENIRLGWK